MSKSYYLVVDRDIYGVYGIFEDKKDLEKALQKYISTVLDETDDDVNTIMNDIEVFKVSSNIKENDSVEVFVTEKVVDVKVGG